MTGTEPTHSKDEMAGVWGTVGQDDHSMGVHYCVPGSCLIGLYPKLAKDSAKYLRPGKLWEVKSHKNGKHRLLRVHFRRWNIENPRTCPECKEYYLLLQEQRGGLTATAGKVDEPAAAKVK